MTGNSASAARIDYLVALRRIEAGPRAEWAAAMTALYADGVAWHGPRPLDDQRGAAALLAAVWEPLLRAFPDIGRRDDIVIGGEFAGGTWVACHGHYCGNFVAPWLGIAPSGRVATLRFGEFCRFQDGKVVEAYVIFDLPDLMRQAGCWPLAPSIGALLAVPGPATHDGVQEGTADPAQSRCSLDLVEAMIAGLMRYDGTNFASMDMERYWHPDFMWYGPGGIGTSKGFPGYRQVHSAPFLAAFPDRVGGDHKARLGEGTYVASTGWPSVRATHVGGGWLGLPPSGRRVGMRVMDFWRRDGDLLAENWVLIDVLDLLNQMGVDILARASITGKGLQ